MTPLPFGAGTFFTVHRTESIRGYYENGDWLMFLQSALDPPGIKQLFITNRNTASDSETTYIHYPDVLFLTECSHLLLNYFFSEYQSIVLRTTYCTMEDALELIRLCWTFLMRKLNVTNYREDIWRPSAHTMNWTSCADVLGLKKIHNFSI